MRYGFELSLGESEGDLTVQTGGNDTYISINGTVDWDYWHHYCLTYDSDVGQ